MSDDLICRLRERKAPYGTVGFVPAIYPPPDLKDALCQKAADAIERLTRERDEAQRLRYCAEDDAEIVKEQYDALLKNSAVKIDTAERKVEKLRGLLKEILEFVDDPYDEIAIYIGNALAETEKADD